MSAVVSAAEASSDSLSTTSVPPTPSAAPMTTPITAAAPDRMAQRYRLTGTWNSLPTNRPDRFSATARGADRSSAVEPPSESEGSLDSTTRKRQCAWSSASPAHARELYCRSSS